MTLLDKLTGYDYKKLAANVACGLALGTSLLFMSPKDVNAQTVLIGGVSAENTVVGNAFIEFKQASDTLNSYFDITGANGRFEIENVVTDIDDINNTNYTKAIADGTVATNMQSGNGRRTFYGAVGQTTQDAIAYNSIGQEVARIRSEYNPATGISKANVDPSSWADGVYILVFKGQENAGAVKFMQLSNNIYENTNVSGEQLLKAKRTANKNILGKITTSEDYIVEITPTDSSSVPFKKSRKENINVNYDTVNEFYFTVNRTDLFDNVDITTTIRTSAKPWDKLGGVTVELYTMADSLVGTGITDAEGNALIENFPINESLKFNIGGKEGYYARNGMTVFMPSNPADSTKEVSFMLPPKSGLVPGTNGETVQYELDDIVELFEYFDITLSKSDGIRYYLDWTFSSTDVETFDTLLARGCEMFGIPKETYTRVNNRIEFSDAEINAYLSGADTTNKFGWNIENKSNQTNNAVANLLHGDIASFGGRMEVSLEEKAFYKEVFGRAFSMNNVSSDNRESYMNSIPEMPTNLDRAYYKLFNDYRVGRWTHGFDTANMQNIAQDMQSQPLLKTQELEEKMN